MATCMCVYIGKCSQEQQQRPIQLYTYYLSSVRFFIPDITSKSWLITPVDSTHNPPRLLQEEYNIIIAQIQAWYIY